jgi:hypothetical protein
MSEIVEGQERFEGELRGAFKSEKARLGGKSEASTWLRVAVKATGRL